MTKDFPPLVLEPARKLQITALHNSSRSQINQQPPPPSLLSPSPLSLSLARCRGASAGERRGWDGGARAPTSPRRWPLPRLPPRHGFLPPVRVRSWARRNVETLGACVRRHRLRARGLFLGKSAWRPDLEVPHPLLLCLMARHPDPSSVSWLLTQILPPSIFPFAQCRTAKAEAPTTQGGNSKRASYNGKHQVPQILNAGSKYR